MEWIVVAFLGAAIGGVVSLMAQRIHMPPSLCILIAGVGAIAGAALDRITGFAALGQWTYYLSGGIVAIGFLSGGLLAFELTHQKRVGS
jgi:hypothetical protein